MVTGTQGEYRFFALPPGTYTLTVTAKGFTRYQQTDLQLLVNSWPEARVENGRPLTTELDLAVEGLRYRIL